MSKGEGLYPAPTKERLNELDAQIAGIQKSTRAMVPAIVPLHDILRQKFHWYYRWTAWPASRFINIAVLLVYIVGASYFALNFFKISKTVLAAATDCTWQSAGSNSWNDSANWSCGNVPNSDNNAILNGTSSVALTIDAVANINSFTVQAGYNNAIAVNNSITTNGVFDASNTTGVTLGANVTIDTSANNGDVSFGTKNITNSSIRTLAINAGTGAVILGTVGSPVVNVSSLTVAANSVILNGGMWLAASGVAMTNIPGGVTLGDNIAIQTGLANFSGSAINSDGTSRSLSISTSTGAITLATVGATAPLSSLTISSSSGLATLNGNITTNAVGGVNFSGTVGGVKLAGTVITIDTSAGNGPVNFTTRDITATAADTQSLVINAGSGAVILAQVGTTRLISLTVTTSGLTTLGGSIITGIGANAGVNLNGCSNGIKLTQSVTITTSSGNGVVNLGSTPINGDTAGNTRVLSINSGSGLVTFGSIGATTPILQLSVTTSTALTLTGNVTVTEGAASNSNINFTNASGGVILGADVTLTVNNSTTFATYYLSFGTNVVNSDTDNARSLTLVTQKGTVTLNAVGTTHPLKSLTVTTTTGVTNLNGNITTGTATGVNFSGAAGGVVLGTDVTITTTTGDGVINFGTRALTNASGKTLTIVAGSGAVTLGAVGTGTALTGLTITSGIVDIGSNSLNITTLSNNGTLKLTGDTGTIAITNFDSDSGTIEYSATSGTRDIKNYAYYNLKVNGSGGTFTLPAAITVNGDLTISVGTLDASAYDILIKGSWLNTGIFLSGTRTVTLDGSGAQTVTAGGIDGNHDLYNLVVANTSGVGTGVTFADSLTLAAGGTFTNTTGDSKITFNAGSTYTFPIINIAGSSGHTILLRSSGTSAWSLNVDANSTVHFIDVAYSNANLTIDDSDGGVNSLNNTGWIFLNPNEPTIGSPEAISASAIRWHFTDNASNETGFKVYDGSNSLVATCASVDLTYCDETGLSANTQYTGRYVTAYNGFGDSPHSGTAASIYTLANTPAASTVANTALTTSLNVTLAPNSNPASTEFAFGIDNDDNSSIDANGWVQADGSLGAAAVWQNNATWGTKTVTGLLANTNYIFKSEARNTDNIATALSSGSQLYTRIETPTSIVFDSVTSSSITIHAGGTISNLNSDSSGLYFHGSGGIVEGTGLNSWTHTNSATNAGLTANAPHGYRVKARNGNGVETSYSPLDSRYTLVNTPLAPTVENVGEAMDRLNVTITAGDGNPDGVGYAIYESSQGKYVQAEGELGTSAVWLSKVQWGTKTVIGLRENINYTFQVKARNGSGIETVFSPSTSKYTAQIPPSNAALPPTVTNITGRTDQLGVAITAGDGNPETYTYAIYETSQGKYIQADGALGVSAVWQSALTWGTKTVTGLAENTQYSFQAKVRNEILLESALSAPSSKYTLISAPSGITFDAVTSSSITMHPTNNPSNLTAGLSGLYYSNLHMPGTGGSSIGTWIQTGTVTATGLIPDLPYAFNIKARNGDGVETDSVLNWRYTLVDTPLAPIVTNIASRTDQLGVATANVFNNPTNITHAIYESSQGKYVQADGTLGDSAVWQTPATWGTKTVGGLLSDTTYYFQVKARNSNGDETAFSPSSSKNTGFTESASIASPTNLRATLVQSTQIDLAWDGVSDVIGYKLYNSDTGVKIATTTDTSQSLTNLSPGTTYRFYLRAYDASGYSSYPSEILEVTTLASQEGTNNLSATFLVLSNAPAEVVAGKAFSSPVKVMAVDGGGAAIKNYGGKIYFSSTDNNTDLKWNKDNAYTFTGLDAGTHQFEGTDFVLKTVGNQVLTVTDGTVSGRAEINVLSGSEVFAKAADFVNQNASKVNTAVVTATAALLLAPSAVNAAIGLGNFLPQIIYWFTQFLQLLGIKPKRKNWGVIFNSQTGQAVSLATVKIFDKEYNRLLESSITDKQGRFSFLVRPGNFYLQVSKTGFIFPSEYKVSGFYENIYAGGNLKIESKDEGSIDLNIPLDPQAKASVTFKWWANLIKVNRFLQNGRIPLMAIGFIFSVIMILTSYNIVYVFSLGLYVVLLLLEYFHSKRSRPYGIVTDIFGHPLGIAIVRIYNKKENRLVATDVTDSQGRFKFLINPGIYYMTAAKPGYIDFKSHIMYLERARSVVTTNIKLKKVENIQE